MKKSLRMLLIFGAAGLIFVLFCYPAVFGQVGERSHKSLSGVNFSNPSVAQDRALLDPYFQCKLAMDRDLEGCKNMSDTQTKDSCERIYSNFVIFFGTILKGGDLSKKVLSACEMNSDKEYCQKMSSAIISKDIASCDSFKNKQNDYFWCQAVVSKDPDLCPQDQCKDVVYYFKAVSLQNVNFCNKIKDGMIRGTCIGFLSKDQSLCENDPGFVQFCEKHCQN